MGGGMDTSMRNERGGGSALLSGLAVAAALLLTGVMMAPQAHAQVVLGTHHKTTADKVFTYPYEAGRTGIAFHATTCGSPNQIVIQTRTADFDLVNYYVIASNNQIGSRAGSGDSGVAVGRVNYLELAGGRNDLPDGPVTVTVKMCDQAPAAYTVTVAVWHDQGRHSDRPASRYVSGVAASEDTGIVIHRSAAECRFTDVRLAAGAPEWLELRQHRANGTADGDGGRRFTVRMERGHNDDRHVRVRFKDDAEPPAGRHAFSVVMERTASSGAGCAGVRPAAYTLGYTLNIVAQDIIWEPQSTQVSVVTGLSAGDLGGPLATEMGPRIHHSSSLCRWVDAQLVGGGSFLGLRLHNTESLTTATVAVGAAVGEPAASFTDVRMQRNAAGDQHLRLVYRANRAVPAGPVTAAVELKPSARCANYVGIPGPHTLSFTATIGAAVANPDPWTAKGFNQATPTGPFDPRAIANSSRYREINTGIYLGYRLGNCRDYHYSLLNHREKFSAYYYDRTRDDVSEITTIDTEYSFFDSYGPSYFFSGNDDHGGFNFVFAPGASVPPGSVLTLNVLLSKYRNANSCGNPAPITLSYRLTISPSAPWGTLANNVASATMLFAPAAVKASASATDTGLRFNRGVAMSVCANVDVELPGGNAAYMELQKYNGTATDGAAASRFTVAMHSGATGNPVGLQFKAGADVPAGTLTVQVVARPDSCSHAEAPVPLTVKYELLVSDRQLWQVHARDSAGRVVGIDALEVRGLLADTGVAVHRSLSYCDMMDVSLPDDAPAWARLQQYGPDGPVGASARSQAAVPMKGTGAADDRHVRLLIAPGADLPGARLTIGMRVAANAPACGTGSDIPAPQMTESVVRLGDTGLRTEAALQLGSAAAVRAIGLETLDAVMARPDAVAHSWSSGLLGLMQANEAELERGEFSMRDLAGEEFSLGLSNSAASGLPAGLALWGRFATYDVGNEVEGGARSDSELFSASFGIDYRLGEDLMLGLGYGLHEIDGEYRGDEVSGDYQLDMDMYQPYVAGRIGPGLLAAFVSQGSGDLVMHSDDGVALAPSEADYQGWGLGWSSAIERWDLRLRAGASTGELDVEDETLALDTEAGAARLAVAYAPQRELVNDLPLRPEIEVAWADDWGDLAGDASWQLAAAFEYAGVGPLHARAAYRRAIAGDGDLSGLEIEVQVDPARGGLGPSLTLRPGYGIDTGAAVFERAGRPFAFSSDIDRGRRLQAEMAWGLAVNGGVLTPYGDWSMDDASAQRRQLGLRLGTGAYGDWNLGWRSAASAADELHLELRIGD